MTMTDAEFDAILAEASPAQDEMTVCLAGKELAEWRLLTAKVAADEAAAVAAAASVPEQADVRLSSKTPKPYRPDAATAARLAELKTKIDRLTVKLKLRALGWKLWAAHMAKHPPRKLPDGTFDPRDRMHGVNVDTFMSAIVPLSIYSPAMTAERWDAMTPNLGEGDLDRLQTMAWNLNRMPTDSPFGRAS